MLRSVWLMKGILLGLIWSAIAQNGLAAPITFNTALPVHAEEVILRTLPTFLRATGDPTPRDRELTVFAVPNLVAYGATPELALFGILPYVDKRLELTVPGGRIRRGASGIGDFTAIARYTAWVEDRPSQTRRVAPFAGLKVPTGADDRTDAFGIVPRPLQPGSGSWDPLLGVIFTHQTLQWELDFLASYQARSETDGFEAGDEARLDASYQHRIFPRGTLGSGVPEFVFAVLETNLVWTGRDRAAGLEDPISGRFTAFLSPGLQWVTRRSVIEATIQLPVIQNLDKAALEQDFVASLSYRYNF